jgi:hypothetical protein
MTDNWVKTKVETKKFFDGTHNVVTYRGTPVVRWNDDEIILNTGGWETHTTKSRMNEVSQRYDLGFRVEQENFDWFLVYEGERMPFIAQEVRIRRR